MARFAEKGVPADLRKFAVLPPASQEIAYRRALRKRLNELARLLRSRVEEVAERNATELELLAEQRQDALGDIIREMVAIIEGVRVAWGRRRTAREVVELAHKTGNNLAEFNRRRIERWFRSVRGVDPVLVDQNLKFALSAFEEANLSLITNMEQTLIDQTKGEVISALREGRRASELAPIIADRLGVAHSRAKLIARDQLGKLNGQLTRQRQMELGIGRYIWQTSEDERVRTLHAELNGETFTWEQGHPTEGHPGEPINCRCVALPILEDVIGPET